MNILHLEKPNCKNCYKCIRHCPVKAIEVKDHRAKIRNEDCILCGECAIACPQKKKGAASHLGQVKEALESGKKVIASVAPSFYAYFFVSFKTVKKSLTALGFEDVFETAEGAYLVKSQYERLIAKDTNNVLISSGCSSVNLLISKYYPEVLPNLAPVLTPNQAHAKLLKERFPDAVIVLVAPCISKKAECYDEGSYVDFVISFEELEALTGDSMIDLENTEPEEPYLSRKFPVAGGVVSTLTKADGYDYASVSGYTACVQAIRDIKAGKISSCFVEMNLCEGGCIGGYSFRKKEYSLLNSELQIRKNSCVSSYTQDYNINYEGSLEKLFQKHRRVTTAPPPAEQIISILQKMGKRSEGDELNCGMCGYSSCREKAAAVIAGKAEINMCLPFMNARSESFSNQIINVTPNAIISVDTDLKIQQINPSACKIFNLSAADVIGQPVSRLMDEFNFVDILINNTERVEKDAFLPEYNVYLRQVFIYDKESSMIVCVMKNISEERRKKNLAMKKKIQAANMADDIVDKQLRIVHEIASLLGETAAETQIAVHDLKGTIMMDNEE